MNELEAKLGYTFRKPELLRQALTHPSTGRPNYQRLEYLGDSILEFCVSDMLYHRYPDWDEGKLTLRRASLVCEKGLAEVAASLTLGKYLLLSPGEEMTAGRQKSSILSDSMEAVLAAVYIDGGYDCVRSLILRLFEAADDGLGSGDNYKGELQNTLQAKGFPLPVYRIVGKEGLDNAPVFTAEVEITGGSICKGSGSSKQKAEQEAAHAALLLLRKTNEIK